MTAVTRLAAEQGYAALTVERVLDEGQVSRATFYQYFANIADCFWSAHRVHADRLFRDIQRAIAGAEQPVLAVLQTLAQEILVHPHRARLLMGETIGAGPTGLLERDALITRLAQQASTRPTESSIVDLPLEILIGATFRFLTMTMDVPTLTDDASSALVHWSSLFTHPTPRRSWGHELTPRLRAVNQPATNQSARIEQVAPRERILLATAAAVREHGFHDLRIEEIAAAANVSRRRFYNEFSNKTTAFIGVYEHAFHKALAVCAPAFFSARTWPEQVWQSALAFTAFLAHEPDLSYVGFVEPYAAGRQFSRRVNDTQLAFTLFLEDGYRQQPQRNSASRATAALTAVTIAEIGFRAARAAPEPHMREVMPLAVYIALAPFISPEQANNFIAHKLTTKQH